MSHLSHRLGFAELNIFPNNIIEVIIDAGVTVTLEMGEEMQEVVAPITTQKFACLLNYVNEVELPLESQLDMISDKNLQAIALVYYTEKTRLNFINLMELRKIDNWNVKMFSGLEMGRQEAYDWLSSQMNRLQD